MKYKVCQDIVFQKIDGKIVAFDTKRSTIFKFNPTASFIFYEMKRGKSQDEIIKEMEKKYKQKQNIKEDVNLIVREMSKHKIISKTSG